MNTINITNARQNLFKLVSDVNKGFNPVNIINNKDKKLLKQTGLESKTKELLDLIAVNPYHTSPTYEKLKGNIHFKNVDIL